MRLLITGAREWTNEDRIRSILNKWGAYVANYTNEEIEIVVGDCKGVDTIAA